MSSRTRFYSKATARLCGYDDHGADKGSRLASQAICGHCGARERYTRKCLVCVYDCRICIGCDDENGQ